jgi:hypothetical protein
VEDDDSLYWVKLDDEDTLVDTPQQLKSQQQPPSSPMQSTETMSLKVSQEDNDFRQSASSSAPLLLLKATSEALEVIGTPQQQLPRQQSAAQSQEAIVSAIAAAAAAVPFPSDAASVASAVTLSTERNISSIHFRGRSVQEWVDIATRSLLQPERIPAKLYFTPVGMKRKHTIAFRSFAYTVDEDDLKAFLEKKAGKGKKLLTR